jgi:hypothetical protein
MADNLPPLSADVTEYGSLNLPELSGPHRPVMGLLYLYLLVSHISILAFTLNIISIIYFSSNLHITLIQDF